eukprot:TRINITY_DN1015_c0_g1_i2.p1 TRINITY_DN1015_c0_g1~~TRINITY_DN1015_c0_g1_i2.p1  ORF type:complete len:301 (-),score=89.51 TRINITY_DN1015_c0_g1_i2:57-827(-)
MGLFVKRILDQEDNRRWPCFITGDLNVDSRAHSTTKDTGDKRNTTDSSSATVGEWGEPNAESEEFKAMMRAIGVAAATPEEKTSNDDDNSSNELVDLLSQQNGGVHPVTIGDVIVDRATGKLTPRETVLTEKPDFLCRESKDYILYIPPSIHNNNNNNNNDNTTTQDVAESENESASGGLTGAGGARKLLRRIRAHHHHNKQKAAEEAEEESVAIEHTQVEPFYIDPKAAGFPCTQLSDHYGVSTTFRIVRRRSAA